MSSLDVEGNKFYVLRKEDEGEAITLHNEMDSPIDKIKEYIDEGTETDNIDLMIVEMEEDEFNIRILPWSTIAERLIKKS